MYEKAPILFAGSCVSQNSTVASGSSSIKIHYFDYFKRFINRINEVYDFSIKYHYSNILLKKKHINFIYNCLFCCNYTCYCVGMVSLTPASRYVTSASHQSRSSVYMGGLIPRNSKTLAGAVLID